MKKFLFCIALLSASLFAENCKTLFTGAAAYTAGDFTSAAEAWQNCVDNGFQNGDLFYNLGNAYFREKRLGLAILNYEKALRFDPTNSDYRYNLKFARSMTKDKVSESEDEENPILNFAFEAHHLFSLKQQLAIILGLVWVIFFLCIARVLSANPKIKTALAVCVFPVAMVLGVFACSVGYKIYRENTYSLGVVIAETADITSGPSDKDQTLNMLSEGTEIEVLNVKDGWVHVRLGEKINGFAKISEVGIVK
ncbi:MAG: tetratricopeptide repeat protein [Fibrobacter sp.]|nr:tetratricopeptide repeat protein [Fibrobacter sp.]